MQEILNKCVRYSMKPIPKKKNKGWNTFYLYRVENLITKEFYIGFRVCNKANPLKDRYFANGLFIDKDDNIINPRNNKTNFVKSVCRYGRDVFRKEIICYFENKQDGLISERNVVNEEMLKNPLCLNMALGGGHPPTGSGQQNNNYGNYWTKEQKKRMSELRKSNGKSKGVLNIKATPCTVFDLRTLKIYHFDYIGEGVKFFDLKYLTIEKVLRFRYLTLKGHLNKEEIDCFIDKCKDTEVLSPYLANMLYLNKKTKEEMVECGLSKVYATKFLKSIKDESNKN